MEEESKGKLCLYFTPQGSWNKDGGESQGAFLKVGQPGSRRTD